MYSYFTKLNYCTKINVTNSKQLYKYLLKECQKLPSGPREHYIFSIKQSFKQHIHESDQERIKQMISKTLDDANWILKKKIIRMFKVPLVTSECVVSRENFWNAVFLYHSLPHVVNRRILCVSQLFFLKLKFIHEFYTIKDILKYSELYSQVFRLESIESKNINTSIITNIFEQYKDNFTYEEVDVDEVKRSTEEIFISVRILLPRNEKVATSVEFVIIDKENNVASFIAVTTENKLAVSPKIPYEIELDKANLLKICVSDIEAAEEKECNWLSDSLFPKILTWATENKDITPSQKSLSLIPEEQYCKLYHALKKKYGDTLVSNWTENTDPLKFVYEDIAIASYLLLLWSRTSTKKQKFVDLGCGNGLLVHILSQEGHDGYGIDIRERKIWKTFPPTTKLKIETIVPSSKYLYPDADWIIGNHSDELSPWIPVIAARSSEKCNYFLLPCCSFEFNGRKYQRMNTAISQYQDFLKYVETISDTCGFNTEIDKLRIPSTKRICLVGAQRLNKDFAEIDRNITDFISERIGQTLVEANDWVENYETRPVVEQVRNCTKLNKRLLEEIVREIFIHLLSQDNYVKTAQGTYWNTGGSISMPDLVKILSASNLKQLKNQCGGLQTLLKNHHYIFLVAKGTVQLRMPTADVSKKYKKSRNCWFYLNHPDGCPLVGESCSYIHP